MSLSSTRTVSWEALSYLNLYRFLIAFLFVALYWIGHLPMPLGVYDHRLFGLVAHVYLSVAVCVQILVRLKRPAYAIQVTVNIFIDIAIVTVLMYASGGLSSGFGMLLVISVAAGSLLSARRIGILYASVATIFALADEVYVQLRHVDATPNYTHAGFLGITFFVTAIISARLAGKVQESQALAAQRGVDLENLAQLNESIVQRLQAGVIVLNDAMEIKLLNEAARRLMDLAHDAGGRKITDYFPELIAHMENWLSSSDSQPATVKMGEANIEVMLSFSRLGSGKNFNILVFLEEVSPLRQRAQQMKLASLGRLTASIAHEIRNPLGAISHAGQLLSESEALAQDDIRLTNIIAEHSRRVNNIIENVMNISRREASLPTGIELTNWLQQFVDEFIACHKLESGTIKFTMQQNAIMVRMDPGQLQQIVWNLCENGMRYSNSLPLLEISCGVKGESARPYLDIIDHGTGVSAAIETHLFEPFFTTRPGGTGLGLYIAKELCEANQASLGLQKNSSTGCVFRISFVHPEKQYILN